jgi:3-hydroxyisobutyrate dehydrogenase
MGRLFVHDSTIEVGQARTAHEIAIAAGMLSLDAPVSGGTAGAEGATLTFMCGGSKEAFEKARPVLESMGRKVVHCGEAGAGQAVKICNNMMMAINMLGVCEGFALAEKLGISHQTLFDVVSTSTGNSFMLTNYCPIPDLVPTTPSSRNYTRGFNTTLLVKDLTLAQTAAQDSGVATPMGAHALAAFRHFMAATGSDHRDFSSVVDYVRAKLK